MFFTSILNFEIMAIFRCKEQAVQMSCLKGIVNTVDRCQEILEHEIRRCCVVSSLRCITFNAFLAGFVHSFSGFVSVLAKPLECNVECRLEYIPRSKIALKQII